jgi:uncharacterized protein (DUF362 family)
MIATRTYNELNIVSIVKVNDDIAKSLRRAINLIGGLQLPNVPILIKPNICVEEDPSGGATTSSQVIKILINEILRLKKDATIKIIESDSYAKYVDKAFKNLGFFDLQEEYQEQGFNVSIVNLSKEPTNCILLKGLYFRKVQIPKILLKPKFLISVAKPKTHGLTQITGVLKNQFGCLPEKDKIIYHKYIDEVIVDINKIIKPDLCLVDGLVGMEGVTRGNIKRLGMFLAGYNPVCVDATLARVMGFKPSKIRHIMLAEKAGLGSIHANIVGEQLSSVIITFKKPNSSIMWKISKILPDPLHSLATRIYERVIKQRK